MEWNPWHGCIRYSEGCKNCYVYRRDESVGRDPSIITKNKDFDLPIRKKRDGTYKIPFGSEVFCCMTSDFFLKEADEWRSDAWKMMQERNDVQFFIITKRIVRFLGCIPEDWGDGYENVAILCTIENQNQCDIRFPIFNRLPIRKKFIVCEPLLGPIDMRPYLTPEILQVTVGGESGEHPRVCKYDWVLDIRRQCQEAGVRFHFKQTGACFQKGNKIYYIPRKYQHSQAKKAGIDIDDGRWVDSEFETYKDSI